MWSYDPGMGTDKDKVRFLVQDTNTNKQLFQDQEIIWVISTEDNIYTAAAMLCDQLVTKAGGVSKKTIGDLSISYNPAFYRTLGGQLRARGAGNQVPYAGGISVGDKEAQAEDIASTSPSIVRNLDNNLAAPGPALPSNNPLTSI